MPCKANFPTDLPPVIFKSRKSLSEARKYMAPEYTRYFAVLWLFRNQVVRVNIITQFSQQIALPSKKTQVFISSWGQEGSFGPEFVTMQTSTFPLHPYFNMCKGLNFLTSFSDQLK